MTAIIEAAVFLVVTVILYTLLPASPFTLYINAIEEYEFLGLLNWLIPIGTFMDIGIAWLTCIGVYYTYQAIMRWAHTVE